MFLKNLLKKIDYLIILVITVIYLFVYLPRLNINEHGDEFYYVPSALTYLTTDQLDTNEIHPPLGKILIASSMVIFGKNPAGWRAGSIISGLLIIILTYIFSLLLFNSRPGAFFSALLLIFDFLHFVQSRIATLDIYTALFILSSIFYGYIFSKKIEERKEIVFDKYLHISALFAGLATAVKLNGLSVMIVLFLFFLILFKRNGIRKTGLELLRVLSVYAGFIIVIHFITYIPIFLKGGSLEKMLPSHALITHYLVPMRHKGLAQIWEWILLLHPHWHYYQTNQIKGMLVCVYNSGNFIFWWGFLIFLVRFACVSLKSKKSSFILVTLSYLSLYLFWLTSFQIIQGHFFLKGGFFYYMLPCVPFMAMMVGETMGRAWESRSGKVIVPVYFIALAILLHRFYPILTAIPITSGDFDAIFGISFEYMLMLTIGLNLLLFIPPVMRISGEGENGH